MRTPSNRLLVLEVLATVIVFAFALVRALDRPAPPRFSIPRAPDRASPSTPFVIEKATVSSGATREVHSATAVETRAGQVRAFWYGGSREGASDVAIYSALFDPAVGHWSDEEVVTTREATEDEVDRPVRKLGNPMVMADGEGRLLLFYVSVSVGGWSGSAVNLKVSEDDGRSWSRAKRLVTSPFVNISTLVRAPGVVYDDGSVGVPAYHELIGKYGELVRVGERGEVLSKSRIGWGRSVLQPVLLPETEEEALVLLRQSGAETARIYRAETRDGGRSFTAPEPTSLPNPDAGIAALPLAGGGLLVAFNESEHDRSRLELARTDDRGTSFQVVYEVDDPTPPGAPQRLSYPTLLRTRDGELHLLYTWDRSEIRHVRFRGNWEAELGS